MSETSLADSILMRFLPGVKRREPKCSRCESLRPLRFLLPALGDLGPQRVQERTSRPELLFRTARSFDQGKRRGRKGRKAARRGGIFVLFLHGLFIGWWP